MTARHRSVRTLLPAALCAAFTLVAPPTHAQDEPLSGHFGLDLVYATSPTGMSQLYQISPALSPAPIALGAPVAAVPSRWAHRRRTLGATETAIGYAPAFILVTPMGDAVGNGALHLVDGRGGFPPSSTLVPTGNPAGYDVLMVPELAMVFAAEDDGLGNTTLRGFSDLTPGTLTPLSPATLTLPGSPSAYVNRIGFDADTLTLHVPTTDAVYAVSLQIPGPQMQVTSTISTGLASPTTNPTRFLRNGAPWWIMGTCEFDGSGDVVRGGWLAWNDAGTSESGLFGAVPGAPGKEWVPAAGSEEVAVVSDGTNAYAYVLLREPSPGTFFVKGAAVGVVRMLGTSSAATSTLLCSDTCGEPFSIPTVSDGRVAFETSFGPPFVFDPADGGERVNIIYSPLHPLGAFPDGLLSVPDPLGGRISTKGMDRPVWSRDGSRVYAATSWFPGAPNPGVPGLEVLDVPDLAPVDHFTGPRTIVPNDTFPNQSILLGSAYRPRFPQFAGLLDGLSFYGGAFHDGVASITSVPFGDVGQKQVGVLTQDADIPDFRAIFQPSFLDVTGPTKPVPDDFGARKAAFNLFVQDLGVIGVTMTSAFGDEIHVQATGYNALAELGVFVPAGNLVMGLPAGWTTTTEFLSL
ncbi:MAG: hypothetical protein H6825_01895 [Planctomycetes bacterium]|nr:hypothetical protein [Planctomycetota bacterium]